MVDTQSRPTDCAVGHTAAPQEASAPHVRDDMTVEVALSVMASARTGHLLICDEDDQLTGRVTRARLTIVRESPGYTDRVRLRDVCEDHASRPGHPGPACQGDRGDRGATPASPTARRHPGGPFSFSLSL
ncbi:CBS domain-containing protein [Streptomyces sp. NPDC005551]|uniref:CBS domain-containing protein n=1 Tax=unclassified Streptomyces TaxID=2593676 RepID=UPI0033EABB4B